MGGWNSHPRASWSWVARLGRERGDSQGTPLPAGQERGFLRPHFLTLNLTTGRASLPNFGSWDQGHFVTPEVCYLVSHLGWYRKRPVSTLAFRKHGIPTNIPSKLLLAGEWFFVLVGPEGGAGRAVWQMGRVGQGEGSGQD